MVRSRSLCSTQRAANDEYTATCLQQIYAQIWQGKVNTVGASHTSANHLLCQGLTTWCDNLGPLSSYHLLTLTLKIYRFQLPFAVYRFKTISDQHFLSHARPKPGRYGGFFLCFPPNFHPLAPRYRNNCNADMSFKSTFAGARKNGFGSTNRKLTSLSNSH